MMLPAKLPAMNMGLTAFRAATAGVRSSSREPANRAPVGAPETMETE